MCMSIVSNSHGVTVFNTVLQYLSLLVGSDPSVLSTRVILQSSNKPSFPIISLVIIPPESKFIGGRTYVLQTTYFTGK